MTEPLCIIIFEYSTNYKEIFDEKGQKPNQASEN